MTIGALTVILHIPASHSLKEKRRALLSLRDLLKNRFNISLAEVGEQDTWQRSVLAIVSVGTQKSMVEQGLSKVIDFIKEFDPVELIDYQMELL